LRGFPSIELPARLRMKLNRAPPRRHLTALALVALLFLSAAHAQGRSSGDDVNLIETSGDEENRQTSNEQREIAALKQLGGAQQKQIDALTKQIEEIHCDLLSPGAVRAPPCLKPHSAR
jgi:hypothetical protein